MISQDVGLVYLITLALTEKKLDGLFGVHGEQPRFIILQKSLRNTKKKEETVMMKTDITTLHDVTKAMLFSSEQREGRRVFLFARKHFSCHYSHLMLFYYRICMWLSYWRWNKYTLELSRRKKERLNDRREKKERLAFADKRSWGNWVLKIN